MALPDPNYEIEFRFPTQITIKLVADKMAGKSDAGGNWTKTTQIAMILNVTKIQLNR